MDQASFAISVLSLASLFSSIFDCIERVRQLRHVGGEIEDAISSLQLEQLRLEVLKDRCLLPDPNTPAEHLLKFALSRINSRVQTVSEIITSKAATTRSKRSLEKIKWVTGEKEAVAENLLDLNKLIQTLWDLFLSFPERVRDDYLVRARVLMASATDDAAIGNLAAGGLQQYPDISRAARVKQLMTPMSGQVSAPDGSVSQGNRQYCVPLERIRWNRPLSEALTEQWSSGTYRQALAASTGSMVVGEWRGSFMGNLPRRDVENRLDKLCELLLAMYTAEIQEGRQNERRVEFGMLKCLGWVSASETFDRFGLVFEYPNSNSRAPKSLSDTIAASRRLRKVPPLGDRFDLAFGICSAIANIISVGWMHRAVRSHNIILFGGEISSRVYLIGFTYARPDEIGQQLSELPKSPEWAFYEPPSVSELPDPSAHIHSGSVAFDLYGLGIVLLEIGLWATVSSKMGSASEFRSTKLGGMVEDLSYRCGRIYQNVVEKCLDAENWTKEKVMQNLAEMLADLKLCHA